MQNPSLQWDDYDRIYKPLYQDLFHYIEHGFEPQTIAKQNNLCTIDYINKFGIKSLQKVLFFLK